MWDVGAVGEWGPTRKVEKGGVLRRFAPQDDEVGVGATGKVEKGGVLRPSGSE